MTCQIIISPPRGQETTAGQGITTLTVSGTASECNTVRVRVHQTQPVDVFTPQKITTVTNGQWSVDFTVAAGDFPLGSFLCGRDNKYIIEVECVDDPTCPVATTNFDTSLITCGNCPDVNITITPGACVNGRRTVHLRAEVVSANDATYTWFFGTDEDNQPGEDTQTGDGGGDPWLPAPNSSGVRVVEIDHVYEPTSDQPQTITVRLVTSSGPNAQCEVQQTFTLEPCTCNLTVSLQVLNRQGQLVSTDECLPPGDYVVEVTSPTGNNIDYAWSVNGVANNDQSGANFNVSIAAGEEKTISVLVEQGGCNATNGVTITGCGGCSDYDAQLQILDSNRRDVTGEDCLPPGDYTVQAISPTGAGNTFRWSVNNVVDATATGATLQVNLGNDDEKNVTLEASREECRATATVTLRTCPPAQNGGDESCGCTVLRILALALIFIGFGLVVAGMATANPVLCGIGIGSMTAGLGLLLVWVFLCASAAGCLILQRMIQILEITLAVIGLVALLGFVIGQAPCALGLALDGVFLGFILSLLHRVFNASDCEWQRDWLDDLLGLSRSIRSAKKR